MRRILEAAIIAFLIPFMGVVGLTFGLRVMTRSQKPPEIRLVETPMRGILNCP